MAGRLVEAIRAYGGEVRTRAPVERVLVEKGRAVGVELAKSGGRIEAPIGDPARLPPLRDDWDAWRESH